MATEYYIVKPDKKEIYCIGKRLNMLSYIKDECYGNEADYSEYECFRDFQIDVISNDYYFMDIMEDETWGTIVDFLYEVYEFISEGKILLTNDCSDTFSNYNDYKEVGSIYDFFERVHADELT